MIKRLKEYYNQQYTLKLWHLTLMGVIWFLLGMAYVWFVLSKSVAYMVLK